VDNFYEQLAGTYKTRMYTLLNICVYIFGVIAAISMVTIPIFVLSLLIALACYFGKKKLYVEYEYTFTNGEIDIDKIVEKKKRKRVINFQIKEVELLAPEDSNYVRDFSNKPVEIVNYFPITTDGKIYAAMLTSGNKRVMIRFLPDDEFLKLCFKYNPKAVKKN